MRRRRSVTLTVLTGIMLVYSLIPLVWLLINSTKTQAGLFDYTREEIERLARERGRLFVASKKALTG